MRRAGKESRKASNSRQRKTRLTSALVALLVETPVARKKKKKTQENMSNMINKGLRLVSGFVSYQTNSLQTEQKVGWGKNVALNS